jgi:hypothetical protein
MERCMINTSVNHAPLICVKLFNNVGIIKIGVGKYLEAVDYFMVLALDFV